MTDALSLTYDFHELTEAALVVEGIDQMVVDEMATTMRRAVDIIEASVKQHTPVGVGGHLRQAWGTKITKGVTAVKGTVTNPLEYALAVEKGIRPGKKAPMIKRGDTWSAVPGLVLWVERVLGVSSPESGRVAYVIALKQKRMGRPGQKMAEKGLAAVKGIVDLDFAGVPARVVAKVEARLP